MNSSRSGSDDVLTQEEARERAGLPQRPSGPIPDFGSDLETARANRMPVMALRPDSRYPDEMDDIVIKDVETVHLEAMGDDVWWMGCYFRNGERVTFHITRGKKPARVCVHVGEEPDEWIDLDGERSR